MVNATTVALVGNPNVGKTTLFNALTGARHRVANWPGVTVSCEVGESEWQGKRFEWVDLPGIYSLTQVGETASDVRLAREFLWNQRPDVVVNVVDGTQLARNLYLTAQLLEMGVPVIVVVNRMDALERRGHGVNLEVLRRTFGCPVLPMVASRQDGVSALKEALLTVRQGNPMHPPCKYPKALEVAAAGLSEQLCRMGATKAQAKWAGLALLEGDEHIVTQLPKHVLEEAKQEREGLEAALGESPDIVLADARYRMAYSLANQVVKKGKHPASPTWTERIDRVVLNRWLGFPIFLMAMYLLFVCAITLGGVFQDFFDQGSQALFVQGPALWLQGHLPDVWVTLLAHGLGEGIHTVLTFVPVLVMLFVCLAWLEASGYMARAAFVMDRLMQVLGLPGRAFVPMIVGMGCNVPAVMSARTLSRFQDRLLTVLMLPFMTCGARLAIFAVFASAFFPTHGATLIFALYAIGLLVALLSASVLRHTVLLETPASWVMELPDYRWPRMQALWQSAWRRLKGFVWRAGKYILPLCVLLSALQCWVNAGQGSEQTPSRLVTAGRTASHLFSPLGLKEDNWPAAVALMSGVLAKEVVVGTLNALYGDAAPLNRQVSVLSELKSSAKTIPDNVVHLGQSLKNPLKASASFQALSPIAHSHLVETFDGRAGAFAYLLFVLLYFPCVSTLAAMSREVGRRWALFSVVSSTGLAYALSVIAYQLATAMRHPVSSFAWVAGMVMLLLGCVYALRRWGRMTPQHAPVSKGTPAFDGGVD